MNGEAFLAFDLGAESGRAAVGMLKDGRLEMHEVHRFLHEPVLLPSGWHWDLTGIWANMVQGLREAGRWARQQNVKIASVGVDTWGVDYVLLSKSGEPMSWPHAYRDPRNTAAFEKVLQELGEDYIYETTGLQFMPINTLYQLVAQRDSEPEILSNADRLLMMPDVLHYFLSGQKTIEATNASTTQLIDAKTGTWSKELLQKLHLPADVLQEPVPPGTRLGTLRAELAEETGISPDVQVIAPATHDTASAVAAVPADSSTQWCYLSSGTWSLLGAELTEPCLTKEAQSVPFTHEGGIDGTFRFLKNIAGLWMVQECRRSLEKSEGREYDYAELTQLAEQVEAFRTLVNPDHPPFLEPGNMPQKIAEFARATGQPEPKKPGELVRCCLESLALSYRDVLGKLESVLGKQFDVFHVVGGGGKNELLNQMTADAINRQVVVGPEEGTVIGNLLAQAKGLGVLGSLDEMRKIVRDSFDPKTFSPSEPAAWDRAYERYRQLRESEVSV